PRCARDDSRSRRIQGTVNSESESRITRSGCRSEKSEEPRAARPVWPPSGAHAGLNAVRAGDADKRCGAKRQERKGEAASRAEPLHASPRECRGGDAPKRFSREHEQKVWGRSRRPLYHAKNGSLVLLAALFRAALF